jgi:carbonic anhydrase
MAHREGFGGKDMKSSFIGRWLTLLDDVEVSQNDIAEHSEGTAFELAGIRTSLSHLGSFPFIRDSQDAGMVSLHGLHFDIGSGRLLGLDKETSHFITLDER